jgi:UDP-N-acetylmuramyl pentapeptide synthase
MDQPQREEQPALPIPVAVKSTKEELITSIKEWIKLDNDIAKAKSEIFSGLKKNGIAVINREDEFYSVLKTAALRKKVMTFGLTSKSDVYVKKTVQGISQIKTPKGIVEIKVKLKGEHNLKNALAAIAASIALKIPLKAIKRGIESIKSVHGRLELKKGLRGCILIDDTYNANPASMRAAIDVLANQDCEKILIIGDMGELGKKEVEYHKSIGAYIKKNKILEVVGTGKLTKHVIDHCKGNAKWFEDKKALINYIKTKIKKNSCVLVKGSRFMKMEEVVDALT